MSATTESRHSCYLSNVFNSVETLHLTVRKLKKAMKEQIALGNDFDAIVCRGVSGMAVGPILAYVLKKRLIIVRKTKADSHASYLVEGLPQHGTFKFVIVDDFISSGKTFSNIAQDLYDNKPFATRLQFVGSYLYHTGNDVFFDADRTLDRLDYDEYRHSFKNFL